MEPNIFATIFYVITFAALLSGVMMVKKTDKKMNIVVWLVVALMGICGFQTFVAGVMGIIRIPINIITLGAVNGVTGGLLWFSCHKKQEKQVYFFEKMDCVALVAFALVLVAFMLKTYTVDLAPHYLAVDAAAHLRMTMGIINTETIYGMYYAALQHSIFIEVFGSLVSSAVYYKLFIISDALQLLLSWAMFYCLIQKYAKGSFLKFAAIIITIIYGVGYPANSTLFGFTYLGTGITIIAFLLIVFDWFMDDDFKEEYSIAMLSLGCLSIFESYVLFMPVVFFAICFAMFFKQHKKKKLISLETVKYGLSIFLMPTIFGLFYTYVGTFGEKMDTTVSGAIANEGGMYRDLFSNFVILIPFAMFAFYKLVKEKKNKLVLWALPLLLIFMAGMFVLGVNGYVSSYYFYKNHYVLWLFVFELFFIAITYFEKDLRVFLVCGLGTWAVVLFVFIFNIETKINEISPLFCESTKAGAYNDIYGFNRDACSLPCYSETKLELYRYAKEELRQNDELVAIASTWEDWYWMEVITNQEMGPEFYHWSYGAETYFAAVEEQADYVVVLYDAEIYLNNVGRFAGYETVFENEAGAILKVK